jgi:oligopeptide transport system ATP-binding protein
MSVIWVTHDMALLARIAERVLVMYGGRIVEDAPAERIFATPRHPYTQALLANLRPDAAIAPQAAAASVQAGGNAAAVGCPFVPRCPLVTDRCRATAPPLVVVSERTRVACWAVGTDEPVTLSAANAPIASRTPDR